MLSLPPQVPRDTALDELRERSTKRLFFRRATPKYPLKSERLERVWMPYYLFEFTLDSKGVERPVVVSVDGWAGEFSLFGKSPTLNDELIEEDRFSPKLDSEKAQAIAKRELTLAVLRRRSRGEKPSVGNLISTDLLLYPFWVYYYERKPGALDILIQDAVTGAKGGAKTKVAILQAFKAQEENSKL